MADPMRDFARPVTEELRRLVVVSPHFDDAVLGCGQLLSAHAGATVVTVLGGPQTGREPHLHRVGSREESDPSST